MKAIIAGILISFLFLQACKVKDSCEMNHTGDICVTNSNNVTVEIYINSTRAFSLQPGERNCFTVPVGGGYNVRCVDNYDIVDYPNIDVVECQKREITVSFYE